MPLLSSNMSTKAAQLVSYIALITLSFVACAQTTTTKQPLLSIQNAPGFNHFQNTLRDIINDRAPSLKGSHHFYIARYKPGDNNTYMLWKEKRMLWILALGDEREESWLAVRYPSSGELLDLDADVVPTQEEVGSSTYLVPQPWVNEKVFQAVVNGDLVVIKNDQ